jgi:hypothetical protein
LTDQPEREFATTMPPHPHHSHDDHGHHHPGHGHPPAAVLLSLLRLSLAERLAIACGLSALLWLLAYWGVG